MFVRVVARQIGVDVVVTILDPLGKILFEADRPEWRILGPRRHRSLERALEIIESGFRVLQATGRYQIELMERRLQLRWIEAESEAETAEFQANTQSNPVPARGDSCY